jgi:3-methyladenine DNA glycosylase AlkC
MPSDLKSFFDARIVGEISTDLRRAHPKFDKNSFARECLNGLDRLELIARGWQIAEAMRNHLPKHFPDAATILTRSLPPAGAPRGEDKMDTFRYLPHTQFVSKYGLHHFEESMHAQYELTQRFTAEFSVRPFFERYPRQTHARFLQWAKDPNVHVRRLVSEGSRPRLPWGTRLRAFQKDPSPVLELLELLKDDPELYVRRSVANNLNDIAKDHPALAIATCRRWANGEANRMWIINHALRSLIKKGNRGALDVVGFASAPKVQIENVSLCPTKLKLGETLRLSLNVRSLSSKKQDLLIDYAVHYVKANGTTAPKVFKLSSITLSAKGTATLRTSLAFRQMSTRKHYPGSHAVDLLINGVPYPLGSVALA